MSRTTRKLELIFMGDACEIEVEVSYTFEREERGARERGSGLQLEPDYPASVSVEAVTVSNGSKRAPAAVDLLPLLSKEIVANLAEDILLDELESMP